ncbi:MAG: hypothetical protein M1838_005475 [Thelocarpon superellum]|nr:MAG: hypothetical protein M1838_005475 [Thelocarpon superellum]
MPSMETPSAGWSPSRSNANKNKNVRAMKLYLPASVLDGIAQLVQKEKKPLQISCGHALSLKVGSHSYPITSATEHLPYDLYRTPPSGQDAERFFTGRLSTTLVVQRPTGGTAGADSALLALQSNMAALNQERQARTPTTRPSHSPYPKPSSNHPSSTTAPSNPVAARLHAIRKALIHLLALRPATEAEVLDRLCCPKEECLELLRKCSERAKDGTWMLDKRSYRDLDVWNFPYRAQEDRQTAVDNAAAAFDRLRLSKEDPLWQGLLPQSSRGKGIVLSKLQLRNGPQVRGVTPTIKIQRTDSGLAPATGPATVDLGITKDAPKPTPSSTHPLPPRTTSVKSAKTSPPIPSPLGSSPPTNASEIEMEDVRGSSSSSSSSSTPLMSQVRAGAGSLKRKAEDSEPRGKRSSSAASSSLLEKAKKFKREYPEYERLYRALMRQSRPLPEQVAKVQKMHQRLHRLKEEIARSPF